MKQVPKTEVFSLFSVITGVVGLAMQSWLFSTVDNKGLLPANHISAVISFLLLAAVVAVNMLFLRNFKPTGEYDHLFPKSAVSGVGSILTALGFGISAMLPVASPVLRIFVRVLGLISVAGLAFGGYCRLQGKHPNCLIYGVVSLFLIFRTLVFCQLWSAQVQVQTFFFPLLASLSLLMVAYYRAAMGANLKNCRQYLLFRQLALFCCLVSIAGGDRLFYLSGAIWMATDYCVPDAFGKYAQQGGNHDASA